MKKQGYDAIFNLREFKFDGCALFFKANKFNLLKSKEINYHREDLMRILDRPNVGLIAMLQPSDQNDINQIDNCLIVGTTHVLFNPKRGDIKLAQIRLLLAEMERMALRKIDNDGLKSYYPFILTGDFNLLPNSSIYHFLERGILNWQNLDYYSLSGHFLSNKKSITNDRINIQTIASNTEFLNEDCKDMLNENSNQALSHNLKLQSVFYSKDRNNRRLITTKHDQACEMVDYIFYHQTPELDLVGFRKLLNEDRTYDDIPYLPNELIGSDHFSLVTKFSLHVKV